jgi:hypothetical protein
MRPAELCAAKDCAEAGNHAADNGCSNRTRIAAGELLVERFFSDHGFRPLFSFYCDRYPVMRYFHYSIAEQICQYISQEFEAAFLHFSLVCIVFFGLICYNMNQ